MAKAFKVIIAGGRDFNDLKLLVATCDRILKNKTNVEVVSGVARGADRLGEVYAYSKGWRVKRFPARWEDYGKSAGAIRNSEMANYADAAIVFWNGRSPGTRDMISKAQKKGMPLRVIDYEKKRKLTKAQS